MASITSLANNQKAIIWDYSDWMNTLNKQYSASSTITPIPMAGNGFSSAAKYNPFRYAGYASAGFDSVDVTNVSSVTETCRNLALSAESSTSYGYLITDGAKLQRLVVSSKTISNAGSWPHTITGVGAITGSDVIAYTANVGGTATPCIFYSWNDSGGAWNVGRFRTDTGAFDDDFMSTVPASALTPTGNNKPHAMFVGANDILYIWDGNKLQAYDGATGADGTCSTAVLTIPQGYIGTSFATYDNGSPYLICFAYYSPIGNTVTPNIEIGGKATAYFYDYLSLDPTRVVPLDDRIVTCGFSWKGTVGCFTEGNNIVNDGTSRISRLKLFNGTEFETAVTFIGNSPIHGGADVLGDSVQWNSEGILHSFGSPFEGLETTFQKLGKGSGTTSGVLRTIGGGNNGFQIISSGDTTSGGLQYMAKNTFAENATLTAPPALPTFNKGMVGKLRSVRVEYGKTASDGRGLNLYMVYQNGSTALIINDLVTTITASGLTQEFYNDTSGNPLPIFSELRPLIEWTGGSANTNAAIIKRIVATYEEVNLIGT